MESIYAYVLEQFAKTDQTYAQIAKGSKVSKRTLEKIARREINDPGVSHVEKLAAYFRKQEMRA